MCGDSTDPESVSRLMEEARAELLFTSPPYADMRTYNGGKELSTELLARFIPAYEPHCEYQVVNLGIKRQDHEIVQYWDDYIAAAHGAGLKLMAWNVWDKMICGSVGQQMSLVPIRHEFIFVFGNNDKALNKTWDKKPENVGQIKPKTRRQADGSVRLQTTGNGDASNPRKEMESVVQVMLETGKIREKHPAVFPVGLPAEYIKAFTNEGDVVAEPFGGSGTTLIACEQLGRECRCMELDPSYCDVIIERWQNLTGETAQKVE
jgi:DNA modification methylase